MSFFHKIKKLKAFFRQLRLCIFITTHKSNLLEMKNMSHSDSQIVPTMHHKVYDAFMNHDTMMVLPSYSVLFYSAPTLRIARNKESYLKCTITDAVQLTRYITEQKENHSCCCFMHETGKQHNLHATAQNAENNFMLFISLCVC